MGQWGVGKPDGISPITATVFSGNSNNAATLPISNAAKGGGQKLDRRLGHKYIIANDNKPSINEGVLIFCNQLGIAARASVKAGMPLWPSTGPICRMMIITPIPDIKPDITG